MSPLILPWPYAGIDCLNLSQNFFPKVPLFSSTKRPASNDGIARGLGRLRRTAKQKYQ
jgi:hypothetical protein